MIKKIAKLCVICLLAMNLAACGEIVETGERGVKTTFGEVVSDSLHEGFYFYMPFTSKIVTLDTKTIVSHKKTQTYTKDVQQATIDYVVNYHLQPDRVHIMYAKVGVRWEEKIVPQVVEGAIKDVIGKWDAVDLIANREKASNQIREAISVALEKRNIIAENFEMTDIEYTKEFEQAVEAKVTAIQRASEAQNKTVQIKEEAEQKIISAKAEAESMRIRTAALKESRSLIAYEAVTKWSGTLPNFLVIDGKGMNNMLMNIPLEKIK